ncbi:MAG: hypothetical protein ACYC5O_23830 [Anaerolineae bacterium]
MVGEGKELLRQAILGLARRLSPRLESLLVANPDLLDQFVDTVIAAIRTETRAAIVALPRPSVERPPANVADRVAAGIDEQALLDRVSSQLGTKLAAMFDKDAAARNAFSEAVAREFMAHLDLEEFAHEIADQVSTQVAQRVNIILPPP